TPRLKQKVPAMEHSLEKSTVDYCSETVEDDDCDARQQGQSHEGEDNDLPEMLRGEIVLCLSRRLHGGEEGGD
ncbi:hypothetical protein PENTCL1PPCAC_20103, partial [Pristionchus entomophagus]